MVSAQLVAQANNDRILFIISTCTLGNNTREREVEVTVEREREIRRGPYYYY